MKQAVKKNYKLLLLLLLSGLMIITSYSVIRSQTIQSIAETLYQMGSSIQEKPKKAKALGYTLQQLDPQKEVLWQVGEMQSISKESTELTILQKETKYGYDVRYQHHTPYLYVALKNKAGYLEIGQSLALYLNPLNEFYTTILIFYLIFALILLSYRFITQRRKKRTEAHLTDFIQQLAQDPSTPRALMIQGESPIYPALNRLSEVLSEHFISVSESEAQFKNLLYDFPVGIFLIDESQNITFMNKEARNIFQTTTSLPKSYLEIIRHPKLLQLIKKVTKTQKVKTKEIHLAQQNDRILSVTLRPLLTDNQLTMVGTLYDLTEIRRVETMQQDFVSNVSHELKTPITSIIGFIETLRLGAIEDKETAETFLQIMDKDAKRLQQLIQEIILLSKNGQELTENDCTYVDLQALIDNLLTHYQPMIQEKQLSVQANIEPNTGLETSLYYFEPVLKNLIENAVIYNKEGGNIQIVATQSKKELHLKITDTGIGMASTELDRIFERFYRIDKARSRNLGGTGLGLSIVKHYTEILDGQVSVNSQLGVGTTFTLTFPIL